MTDRKWLLDITIIRVARKCASLVEQEFGVRLPLAHSAFLERMQDYAARSSSRTLKMATDDLDTLIRNVERGTHDPEADLDMIEYMGRQYPRWRDGKEFSGVYRGAPVYRETEPPSEPG